MRKKRLLSAAALSVSMALSLSACVVKDGKIETDPTSQTTTTAVKDTEDVKETSATESSEEVTTTVDVSSEPVSEEETPTALEESTENDTEEVTDEVTTEEESTEEDTTPEETTIEEEPTPEETTTPETTTPEPTTPEPTTPEPTTEQPTTPEPLIVETTTTKEPETKVELVSIKAEVKGTHYIGDTLTGSDFVVTGTYSDGHTESLNGWGADPLKLTSAETKITVSKGTVKTVITVKAQEKPAATVASVSATVSGTHYIGDTLTGADFTVTVKMSDGTTLTNPAGWAAAPLTLSAASTNVTVTYGGVSGVVTVNASERPTQPQNPTSINVNGLEIVKNALQYYNRLPYVSGGRSLTTGTDCSNFTSLIYAQYGISISGGVTAQYNQGTLVSLAEAKPGDIVIKLYAPGTSAYAGHAGIFIGKNPDDGGYCYVSEYPEPGGGNVSIGYIDDSYKALRIPGVTNTYTGTQENAFIECDSYLAVTGINTGYLFSGPGACGLINCKINTDRSLDTTNAYPVFAGSTPLGRGLYINLTSHGKEYDGIIETWKKYFIDNKTIYTYSGNDGDSLCCIDGKWYTSDEACIALGLGINELEEYRYFYGKFW